MTLLLRLFGLMAVVGTLFTVLATIDWLLEWCRLRREARERYLESAPVADSRDSLATFRREMSAR
jgi:hypothetical protein